MVNMLYEVAAHAVNAGHNVLMFDGPGQGSAAVRLCVCVCVCVVQGVGCGRAVVVRMCNLVFITPLCVDSPPFSFRCGSSPTANVVSARKNGTLDPPFLLLLLQRFGGLLFRPDWEVVVSAALKWTLITNPQVPHLSLTIALLVFLASARLHAFVNPSRRYSRPAPEFPSHHILLP